MEAKYPERHADLDAIASSNGIPINPQEGRNPSTWGDGSIKTVADKIAELERRGISAREAEGIEAFIVRRGVNRVELNVVESERTIVLEADEPYETSDPSLIAALRDHPSVRHVNEAELEELADEPSS